MTRTGRRFSILFAAIAALAKTGSAAARREFLRSARVLAAVALIALVAALALPGAAQAQSVTTLVSNTGHVGSTSSANAIGAQPFTTGSAAVLTSVDVYLGANGGLGVEDIRVRILQDDSGSPGTELVTLPYLTAKVDNAVNTFTAPADTNLAAGTTYFVELSENGDHGVNWSYTSSHLEDDGGATGWEISDTLYYKNSAGDPAWSTLSTGVMVIAIKGTAAGDTPTPSTAEVTIAADQPAFTAGLDDVTFTLTRTGDPAAALDVAVALTQDQDLLESATLAQTVSFGAGNATATLTLSPVPFEGHTVTQEATLTATVQAESGYSPGSPNTANTRILVTDPAVTVWIEETAYTFAEDATDATVVVIARTATGVPSPNRELLVSFSTVAGQAAGGVDYTGFSHQLKFQPSDFTSDGAVFTARQEVTLAIVDDLFDKPDETLTLSLQQSALTPLVVAFRQPDGTACRTSNRCDVTVTITDNDASTDATLSGLSLGTGVTLDPAFAPGTLTYTADVANSVDEVTVTPSLGDTGATPEFLNASDATLADADDVANGQQVALAVGDTVFKVQVTAEDTTTTQTYTVTVTRAAADTPTCTLNTGDIWCGVVTPALFSAGGIDIAYGFIDADSIGTLPNPGFSVVTDGATNSYTIDSVVVGVGSNGGLSFRLTSALTAADAAKLVLHVDGSSDQFAFSVSGNLYVWPGTDLDWSSGDPVTLRLRDTAAATPPDAPTGFTATVGDAQVALAWKAARLYSGVTGHEFRYKTDGDYPEDWTAIAYSAPDEANENAFTVTGLTNEVAHTFELRAVNAAGGGDAATAGPVTPTPGICGRTQKIQDAILAEISDVDDCAAVTVANLASITTLGNFGFGTFNQGITSLQKGDFAGLTSLTILNLGSNGLTSLPEGIFSGLAELAELNLGTNELEPLPEGAFAGLTALEDLQLSSNDLSSLPEGLFSGLTALTILRLQNNALNALPEGLFSGLTALDQLDLDGNSTDQLPLTVTVEKVGINQVRAKVLAGAPFAVDIPVTLVDGTLAGSATVLSVAAGSVDGTAVTVTRTAGTTAAVTVDVDLTTQPTLPSGHQGYIFKKASTNLPATILPDATLSALSLGTGVTLDPTFAPGTTSYTAAVGNAVDEVTVTATTTDTSATPEFLNASDTALDDADDVANGHQVALAVGDTVFKVQVTAEDGTTTQTYTVTVNRAAQVQMTTTFVSTTGESRGSAPSSIMAQSFTAGSNLDGYTLSDVALNYDRSGSSADLTVTRVKIRRDNAGAPGDLVANLLNPASFSAGILSFAAPANTTLEAGETYWVVLNEGYDSASDRLRFWTTSSDDQTVTTADPNWSIADTRLWKLMDAVNWGPPSPTVVMLAVNATTPASTDATLSGLTVTGGGSDLVTFVSGTTSYTAQVSFTDDAGNDETLTSAATDAVAAPEPPASPTGLSATASYDQVTLSWDDPGDDTITGYVILRRNRDIHAEGEFTTLVKDTGTAATTYTDDTVEPETPYTYRIKAINEHGESERSRWFHIDIPAAPVPAKPTGLSATASHDSVTLTWDDPGDDTITGYVILRRNRDIHAEGEFTTLVKDTGTAATTYTDDTVEPETPYTYRIKAINEHGGVSERSRWFHIQTQAAP